MKIAAISDIHGNLLALKSVLADIEREGIDLIVNLGDILSGPLWPAETADLLIALDLPTIRGNHERQLLTLPKDQMEASDRFANSAITDHHRAWISSLPETRQVTEDVFLCHGTPDSDLIYLLEEIGETTVSAASSDTILERLGDCKAPIVLCGHTHFQRCVQLGNGQMIVNPGSVGLPAYEDDTPTLHKIESGTPHARYAVIADDDDRGWRVDLRIAEYDWEVAAKLAEQRDSPDWSRALRTGFC